MIWISFFLLQSSPFNDHFGSCLQGWGKWQSESIGAQRIDICRQDAFSKKVWNLILQSPLWEALLRSNSRYYFYKQILIISTAQILLTIPIISTLVDIIGIVVLGVPGILIPSIPIGFCRKGKGGASSQTRESTAIDSYQA